MNGYFEGHVTSFDGNYWSIFMEAPDGFDLIPGTTYADLILWPFNFSNNYGLSVQGFGSACSSLGTGSQMTINELTRQAQFPNALDRFDATFVQFCGSSTGALRGRFRFETPPDTTPPTLYLSGDLTLEAADGTAQAVANYAPYAYDDRDGYLTATCDPPTGSTFSLGTSTISCTATDAAGNTVSGSFRVIVLPALNLVLRLDSSSRVTLKSGVVTLTGTVRCGRAATVYLSGDVKQVVARRATLSGTYSTQTSCVPPLAAWQATVTAANGNFGAGNAHATATAYSCEINCHFASAGLDIKLKGSN